MKGKVLTGLVMGILMFGFTGMAEATMIVSENLGSDAYTASHSWGGHTPDLAFDGDFNTGWNSGDYPMEWIEVDLGQQIDISKILLSVAQHPSPANTTHEVWSSLSTIGNDRSGATLLYTFAEKTYHDQLLTATFTTPVLGQYFQIRTTNSPSWVAWNEIQIMSNATAPVPEPATILLFSSGLAGLVGSQLRRKKK